METTGWYSGTIPFGTIVGCLFMIALVAILGIALLLWTQSNSREHLREHQNPAELNKEQDVNQDSSRSGQE